jgi:hypothetical protein
LSEFIHDPGNEAKIERVYVFLSIDANGNNGVVAEILPGLGSTPLVTGSRKTARAMIPIAQKVADRTGKKVGLYVFARVEGEELWQSE